MTSSAAPSSTEVLPRREALLRKAAVPLAAALAYAAAAVTVEVLPVPLRIATALLLLLLVPGAALLRAFRLPPEPAGRFFALLPVAGAGVTILGCLLVEAFGVVAGAERRLAPASILGGVGLLTTLLLVRPHPGFRFPRAPVEPLPAALAVLSTVLLLAAVESMDAGGPRAPVLLGVALAGLSALLPLLREDPPQGTALLAVGCAAAGLLVARAAGTGYLVGGDVFSEYQALLTTLAHGSAFPPGRGNILTSSLGVSHLPAAFALVGGVSPLATFKVVMPALLAVLFLLVHALGTLLVGPRAGTVAALFALVQVPTLHLLTGQVRVGVAALFSAALFLVVFSPDLGRSARTAWAVLLCALLTLSYYMAPLLLLAVLALVLLARVILRRPDRSVLTPAVALTLGAMVLTWWDTLGTAEGLKAYVLSLKGAWTQLLVLLSGGLQVGGGDPAPRHAMDRVMAVANYAAFLGVAWGALTLLRRFRRFPAGGTDVGALALVSTGVAAAWLAVPGLGRLYAGDRLFLQLSPILAVAFAAAVVDLSERLARRPAPPPRARGTEAAFARRLSLAALLALFVLNTHLGHAAAGVPKSEVFDPDSEARAYLEVTDEEVAAARWIVEHRDPRLAVVVTSLSQPGRNLFLFTPEPLDSKLPVLTVRREPGVGGDLVLVREVTLQKGLVFTIDPDGSTRRQTLESFGAPWEEGQRVHDAGGARAHVVPPRSPPP